MLCERDFTLNMVVLICLAGAMACATPVRADERDPFVSILDVQAQNARADLSGLDLKGIIWEASRPVAILNDTLLCVGDVFSGFKVVKIDKDKVTLTQGKESYELSVEAPADQGKEEQGKESQEQSTAPLAPLSLPGDSLAQGNLSQNIPQELPK